MKVYTIAIICCALLFGCDSKDASHAQKTSMSIGQELIQFDEDKIALLSMKYHVPDQIVSNILIGYIDEASIIDELAGQPIARTDRIKKVIAKLSQQHNIKQDVVASIIVEYKLLTIPDNIHCSR
jgi:hypothetical protein